MKYFICCLITATVFKQAIAGGFQVNLQGARQNGMAQCGTALSLDASAVFFNPSALNFLDSGLQVNFGVNFVFARVDFLSEDRSYSARNLPKTGTPLFFYVAHRLKKIPNLSVGLSVNNPFGASIKYEDEWAGKFIINEISLKTFSYQPTLSYKIGKKLSIGAGLNIYTGDLYIRRNIPTTDSTGMSGQAQLTGRGSGFGFNAGITFKPNQQWQIGLNFRSNALLKLNRGVAQFNVPASLTDSFPETSFNSQIRLPFVLSTGISYRPTTKLLLTADVNYTAWSSYDTLKFDYAFNSAPLKDTKLTKAYKNVFCYRVGAEYIISPKVLVRVGFYHDRSPVSEQLLTPDSPDANRNGITGGISFFPVTKTGIDFSMIYTFANERFGGHPENGFYGTYKSSAVIPTLGIHMKF